MSEGAVIETPATLQTHHSSRITQLDGVRGIAIALVFIHHALAVRLLWMGLDLFFVLSGFLITGVLYNKKELAFKPYIAYFYQRRARRLLPPYVLLLIVTTLLFGTAWLRHWYLYIGGMNFFYLLHIPMPTTLVPLHSLAVEEQFYLLWPFAVFCLNRKQLIACASFLIVLAPVLRYICTPMFSSHWNIYMLLPFRMDTLAAGALVALLWPDLRNRLHGNDRLRHRIGAACVFVALLAAALLVWLTVRGFSTHTNTRIANVWVYVCTLALMATVFVFALVGNLKRFFSWFVLIWIGRLSYSIYLFHETVLWFLHGQLLIATAVTLALALILWFCVERPILNMNFSASKVLISRR